MNNLVNNISAFHFLRPEWLLLLPVLTGLIFWLKQQRHYQTGFEQWIHSHLLQAIRVGHSTNTGSSYYALAVIWVIATVALAGPVWQQLPQQLHESESAVVIILDLSPSMNAEDNKPSRIVRARLKIRDLLSKRKDGLTALVVYAGEAHIVTPLTDDTRTIINLLPTLKPGLLPIPGSNIEMAVAMSRQLVLDSGLNRASFFLVTDGIDSGASTTLQRTMSKDIDLFILGVGTEKGAPIPVQEGFLKNDEGQIITAQRNDAQMLTIAQASKGTYLPLQADDSDIEFVINRLNQPTHEARALERNIDKWHEFGPTLLLFILPLAALAFRRGYILVLTLSIIPLLTPEHAYAWSFKNLWQTPDQQAEQAFHQEDYSTAEKQFNNTQWRGSAAYRNKQYEAAAQAFSQGNSASDHYNRGNALAQLGKLDKALNAYDEALKRNPDLKDAKENRQLVEQLKQQQEQQANNQTSNNNNSEQADQQENQTSQDKQSQGNSSDQQQSNEQYQQESQEGKEQQQAQHGPENEHDEQEKNTANNADTKGGNEEHTDALAHLTEEEKQALAQWLRKIPDDPSGLLRRKFEYEFQQRRRAYQQGQWQLPDNNAHKRY